MRIDEMHEPKRAEDFSALARISSAFIKWNWAVSLFVAFIIALGFDFQTPSSRFKMIDENLHAQSLHIQMRVDSLKTQMALDEADRAKMFDLIEGLAIDVCQRRTTDAYAYQRLGCRQLLINRQ